jgi:serine phosphatase RsbU (regulator of sigma subunit)
VAEVKAVAAVPLLDWDVASRAFDPADVSGDRHLVRPRDDGGMLLAVLDGAGHGAAAAEAAGKGTAILEAHASMPLAPLVERCHDGLRGTRGAAMTLVALDGRSRRLTWIGVGNVEALLWGTDGNGPWHEHLLLRGGLVGCQLPRPSLAMHRLLQPGDVIVLATDGIRGEFVPELDARDTPGVMAARILERHAPGHDDALVLVARTRGGGP